MQTPQLAENDGEKPESASDGQQKEQETRSAFVGRLPVSLQDALRSYQERYSAQHKQWCNDYVAQPALAFWRYVDANSRWIAPTALTIASIVFLGVWASGRMDANTVIAIFTIVMAWTTWKGWVAMSDQNSIMLNQMKQTDAMVEQMQIDNRAWLAVMPVFENVEVNKTFGLKIRITNVGKTPARIKSVAWDFYHKESGSFDEFCNAMDTFAVGDRETVIPPGTTHYVPLDVGINFLFREIDIKAINDGKFTLGAAGKMIYFDINKELRQTTWCCRYHPFFRESSTYHRGNDMT